MEKNYIYIYIYTHTLLYTRNLYNSVNKIFLYYSLPEVEFNFPPLKCGLDLLKNSK